MRMLRGGGLAAILTMALVAVPAAEAGGAASDIKSRITELRRTLSAIGDELTAAERELDEAEAGITKHRAALADAREKHAILRENISRRAADLYRTADTGALQLLAQSTDLDVMLGRMSYLDQLRRGETEMLEQARAVRRHAATEAAALSAQLDRATRVRDRLTDKQKTLQFKLSELQKLQSFLGSGSRRTVGGRSRGVVCPVVGPNIVSNNFGDPRPGGPHAGVDIRASHGQHVRAILPGTIVETPYGGWIGVGIILRDLSGNEWWYAHLSSETVRVGQRVASGELIGRVGCTGRCYGNHLHFEYHPGGGDPRNPYGIVSPVC